MIYHKTFYGMKCDTCGGELDDEQYWDVDGLKEIAADSDWEISDEGKHTCWGCVCERDSAEGVTP